MEEELRNTTVPWRRGPLNEIEKTLAKEVQGFWNENSIATVVVHSRTHVPANVSMETPSFAVFQFSGFKCETI